MVICSCLQNRASTEDLTQLNSAGRTVPGSGLWLLSLFGFFCRGSVLNIMGSSWLLLAETIRIRSKFPDDRVKTANQITS